MPRGPNLPRISAIFIGISEAYTLHARNPTWDSPADHKFQTGEEGAAKKSCIPEGRNIGRVHRGRGSTIEWFRVSDSTGFRFLGFVSRYDRGFTVALRSRLRVDYSIVRSCNRAYD